MTDRLPVPARALVAKDNASRRSRGRRPSLEILEGRALLSTGGTPDFGFQSTDNFQGHPGFSSVRLDHGSGATPQSLVTGEALQPDGKIVVVATQYDFFYGDLGNKQYQIAVGRLNADGSTDATFGQQGSVLFTGSGPGGGLDKAVAVAVQADGKVVVVGNVTPAAAGSPSQIVAYRLNADGSTDTTFGTDGLDTFQFRQGSTGLSSSATTLAIEADGKIVIGGSASGVGVAIARLNPDGTFDSTFGTSGQALVDIKSGATTLADTQGVVGLVIQPDGKIAFDTNDVDDDLVAGRLNADGSADSTFGTGGQVIVDFSTSTRLSEVYSVASGLAIQPDGKLIVVGQGVSNDQYETASSIEVYRLDTLGALDPTFGSAGLTFAVTLRDGGQTVANSVVVQPDDKIVVGGNLTSFGFNTQTPTLIRLNPDGSNDLGFGTDGEFDLPDLFGQSSYQGTDTVNGLAIQPDGKILASIGDGVARLLGSGASNDFDGDGTTDPAVLLTNFAYPIFAYRSSSGGPDSLTAFGSPGAGQTIPAPGAYDGSGVDELGVYLPAFGAFAYRSNSAISFGGDQVIYFGMPGAGNSIPAEADYTGSGKTELAVYEPSTGSFLYRPADNSGDVTVPFGIPGAGNSIPAPADYTGSGHDEIAVYLPTLAAFAYRPADGSPDQIIGFGMPGAGNSIPVPGDYDGSGHTELAVYLPTLGAYAYRPYNGGPDQIIGFGMPGAGNSIPMPGDYDGSGHLELGVYLPTLRAFAYRPAGGGPDVIEVFGSPGVGNSIPFNTQAVGALAGGSGGGPSAFHPNASANWVDFVPEVAGQPKKSGHGGAISA